MLQAIWHPYCTVHNTSFIVLHNSLPVHGLRGYSGSTSTICRDKRSSIHTMIGNTQIKRPGYSAGAGAAPTWRRPAQPTYNQRQLVIALHDRVYEPPTPWFGMYGRRVEVLRVSRLPHVYLAPRSYIWQYSESGWPGGDGPFQERQGMILVHVVGWQPAEVTQHIAYEVVFSVAWHNSRIEIQQFFIRAVCVWLHEP